MRIKMVKPIPGLGDVYIGPSVSLEVESNAVEVDDAEAIELMRCWPDCFCVAVDNAVEDEPEKAAAPVRPMVRVESISANAKPAPAPLKRRSVKVK